MEALESPREAPWSPRDPREEGRCTQECTARRGVGPLSIQKPYQTALGILPRLNVPGGTVADVLYPDEGHGFARPQNRIDFQGRTETFLEKHLGGRSEVFTPPEGTTALLPILDGTLGKPVASAAPA